MDLDRRQFLAAGSFALASCGTGSAAGGGPALDPIDPLDPLDRLFAAHSALPPENASGANHYPMAAEAMHALGHGAAVPSEWVAGARHYTGELPRIAPIDDPGPTLGDPARHGDWFDRFRGELAHGTPRAVTARWLPRLAPGLAGAMLHGLIRTAHAVRALRRRDTPERRAELAAGLAYWASHFTELPTRPPTGAERRRPEVGASDLAALERPAVERGDVGFHDATSHLLASPQPAGTAHGDPARRLAALVRAATLGFLEMLALEQQRIWLLHAVTGPAAVALLLPEVGAETAHRLVAEAERAVLALFRAFGAPFEPGRHLRDAAPPWPELSQRAAASGSVHGVKLIEALRRCDDGRDLLCRSVAAQWFEWV